jgi:hypothetical protein
MVQNRIDEPASDTQDSRDLIMDAAWALIWLRVGELPREAAFIIVRRLLDD